MLAFNPEPSLTIVAFWAERVFRTHPPCKASAPPERRADPNASPEFKVVPSQFSGTDGTQYRCQHTSAFSSEISIDLEPRVQPKLMFQVSQMIPRVFL